MRAEANRPKSRREGVETQRTGVEAKRRGGQIEDGGGQTKEERGSRKRSGVRKKTGGVKKKPCPLWELVLDRNVRVALQSLELLGVQLACELEVLGVGGGPGVVKLWECSVEVPVELFNSSLLDFALVTIGFLGLLKQCLQHLPNLFFGVVAHLQAVQLEDLGPQIPKKTKNA